MVRRILRGFLWLLAVAAVVGSYVGYRLVWGTPFTITQLADRQAIFFLMDTPELLTAIGLVDGSMLDFHSGKFVDYGVAERDQQFAVAEKYLAEVRAFDRSALNFQDQITYDILQVQYSGLLDDRNFPWTSSGGLYPIAPLQGGQIGVINFMIQSHTIKNRLTAENYVKRVALIADRLDKVTAESQRQYRLGVILPVSLLDKSLAVIRDIVAPQPAQHPLVLTLGEKIDKAKSADIDASLKASLMAETARLIQSQVYPAYARMITALEAMRPMAEKQTDGVDTCLAAKPIMRWR